MSAPASVPDAPGPNHPGTSDSALVRQVLAGARDAFGWLVVRHSRAVRAAVLSRLGRTNDLDDLVQEAFLRAYQGLSRLEDPGRFGAFVHRIAHNVSIDRLRRSGREPEPLAEIDLSVAPEPARTADVREERLERLRLQVGKMPATLREAVLLFYFEQKSSAEIGAVLAISEAAVQQRLHRARQHLKAVLGEGGSA
ncbi:MAG: RNA polymerase sigma factor [Planctomycetes bacterium]|nr:RNA polymerase sigma factor [Planctomycetota bacterium]